MEHGATHYVIRPSCNYIPGQLDGVQADVLFLAMAGLGKAKPDWQRQFFAETVDKVAPKLVIPLHWDNFFVPLYGPVRVYMRRMDDTGLSLHLLAAHCTERGIDHIVQLPLTSMTLFE